jgi:hypothetical protein
VTIQRELLRAAHVRLTVPAVRSEVHGDDAAWSRHGPTVDLRAVLGLIAAFLGGGIVLAAPASAATVTTSLRASIADLPVATEVRTGYTRDRVKALDRRGQRLLQHPVQGLTVNPVGPVIATTHKVLQSARVHRQTCG